MSDDVPSRIVDVSRLLAKAVVGDIPKDALIKLSGLAQAQKSAALTIETLNIAEAMGKSLHTAAFDVNSGAAIAQATLAQVGRLTASELAQLGSVAGSVTKEIARATPPLVSEMSALTRTFGSMDQVVNRRDTYAEAIGGVQRYIKQGIKANLLLGLDFPSVLRNYAGDFALLQQSCLDWGALLYPAISIRSPHRDTRAWTEEEEEEVYEIERTDSGLYTAKRGRGRPVGSTYVKQEQYVQVLHLYLDRHGRAPSIKQLAAAIDEVLTIPISMDTVYPLC